MKHPPATVLPGLLCAALAIVSPAAASGSATSATYVTAVVAVASTASAAGGEGTLRAAVDRAARLDPSVRTLGARAGEIDASQAAAQALFPAPPTAGASLRRDRPDRDLGLNELEFEVGLPLWLPGQRALRQRLAGDEGMERDAALADARLQVAGRVRESLWALAYARLDESAARRRIATAERLTADVERRVAAGVLARADLLLARTEAAGARSQLIEAASRVEQGMHAWRALTGDSALPASFVETAVTGEASTHTSLAARAFDLGELSLVAMLRALALADEAQADLDRQVAARNR
ncbi:MAG: TolC family protein, partial [Proteobacteria bacterium]|nr:TolC family protein [Pseudomonadota bacterium]